MFQQFWDLRWSKAVLSVFPPTVTKAWSICTTWSARMWCPSMTCCWRCWMPTACTPQPAGGVPPWRRCPRASWLPQARLHILCKHIISLKRQRVSPPQSESSLLPPRFWESLHILPTSCFTVAEFCSRTHSSMHPPLWLSAMSGRLFACSVLSGTLSFGNSQRDSRAKFSVRALYH